MTTQIIGADAATKTQRQRRRTADGRVVDTYHMPVGQLSTFLGTLTFGTTAVDGLVLAEIDETTSGGSSKVSLTFVPPSTYTGRYGGTTTTQKEGDSNAQETDIRLHPDYSAGLSVDGIPNVNGVNKSAGLTSYLNPAPTYTTNRVVSSFTWSEANIVDQVGKRQAPTGMTSPTTGRWLKVAFVPIEDGDVVRIRETWQYNPEGVWDPDVYKDAT
jgi:hypothetical protein